MGKDKNCWNFRNLVGCNLSPFLWNCFLRVQSLKFFRYKTWGSNLRYLWKWYIVGSKMDGYVIVKPSKSWAMLGWYITFISYYLGPFSLLGVFIWHMMTYKDKDSLISSYRFLCPVHRYFLWISQSRDLIISSCHTLYGLIFWW